MIWGSPRGASGKIWGDFRHVGLDGVVSKGSLTSAAGCWAVAQFRGNQPRLRQTVDFGERGVCQG